MRVLDLFSGVGGISLGLERAGMQTVAFCEIEPFCRKVLRKHWPGVPVFEDVTTLRGEDVGPVDLICGGPPCQPFSSASAGRGRGTKDDRWLWPEMRRLVQAIRPAWVLVENVTHFDGAALEQVVSDLEASGYEVAPPLEVPACAFGHDHWRPRLWVLGYAHGNCKPGVPVNAEVAGMQRRRGDAGCVGAEDGLSTRVDGRVSDRQRLQALGNAVCVDEAAWIGRHIMAAAHAEAR